MIYLIKEEGECHYKIGRSKHPYIRLAQLQTAHPKPLELIKEIRVKNDILVESALHRTYASTNMQGEWFILNEIQLDDFEKICQQLDNNFNVLREQNSYLQKKGW